MMISKASSTVRAAWTLASSAGSIFLSSVISVPVPLRASPTRFENATMAPSNCPVETPASPAA